MKRIEIAIQAAYRDWSGGVDFCVKKLDGEEIYKSTKNKIETILKGLELKLPISYVVPNRKEERNFFMNDTSIAKEDNKFFFGNEFDVLDRLLSFSRENKLDLIYRINASFWHLNSNLCAKIIKHKAIGDADIIMLPPDFPHGFAGELIKVNALSKLRKMYPKKIITNPVAEIAAISKFKIEIVQPLDGEISNEEIQIIRKKRLQYEPERAEYNFKQIFTEGSIDHKRYLKAAEYIDHDDVVLDIACGSGYGSYLLAQHAQKVTGADYDKQVIDHCQSQFSKINLDFETADITQLQYPNDSFDAIVSMETIEHVDENLFLDNVCRVLKKEGKLILSTPQNNYGFCLTPWHIKEYSVEEIKKILTPNFNILKVHGVTSSLISDNSEGGDRMIVIAEKK